MVNPFGLADVAGIVSGASPHGHPEMTSLLEHPAAGPSDRFECRVETGDRYLSERGVEVVDFLKVDAEGADLRVLKGFADAIRTGRVGAIQFEFTLWAAIARTWLADFYDFLEPAGYRLGKIYPNRVEWRAHRPEDEIFVRANYLAVNEHRDDMLAALGV